MRRSGLALCCPITNQQKGYPYEVVLPEGFAVTGVILVDQVKSLDWRARDSDFIATVPTESIQEVLNKLLTLLS